jgi:phenylacetate-coenzyme A ligase PaaK-like adenylate-forming protein
MQTDPGESTPDSVQGVYRAHEAWRTWTAGATGDPYRNLLQHLRSEVPFYRNDTSRNDTSRNGTDRKGTGEDLPLVDRRMYQTHAELFRTPAASMAHRLTSSGTTGGALTVPVSEVTWYAVNYHFFEQIRQLAELPLSSFSGGSVAVVFVSNKPGRGNVVRVLPSLAGGLYVRLQLGSRIADTLAAYGTLRAPILYGKPTYLSDLRTALIRSGASRPPWRPQLLLVSGEPLHEDDRRRLTAYFGAPIIDALTSAEGGLIAATKPDERHHTVLGENVRLEVRADDGRLDTSGAGEIVLTNLVYRGTVFARYRTGDQAELHTDATDGRQRLLRLHGREPASLQFHTRRLPAEQLSRRLGQVPGLGDFQVTPAGTGPATVRWVADAASADPDAVRAGLRAAVHDLLPEEEVVLLRCMRITPPGGKKRRFLPTSAVGEERQGDGLTAARRRPAP